MPASTDTTIASNRARDAEIVRLRESGLTYRMIGQRFSITRQRVHQILKRKGRAYRIQLRKPCRVTGCETLMHANGYCNRHYARTRKTGDPGPAGLLKRGRRPRASYAP